MTKPSKLLGRRYIPGQVDCQHTVTEVKKASMLPPAADPTCPICSQKWFSKHESTKRRVMPLIQACGHAICSDCFEAWRKTSLMCMYRCPTLALNIKNCLACREWEGTHRPPPPDLQLPVGPDKRVVVVCRDMWRDIKQELAELEDESRAFRIPGVIKRKILAYMRKACSDYDGQYHRHNDLAELLDPLRGSDIDTAEVEEEYHGTGVLVPCWSDEPWLTTVIRKVCRQWDEEDGFVTNSWTHGEFRPKHLRTPEKFKNADGHWVDDWPIKCVVGHQIDEDDGELWYHVRYIGFGPASDEVVSARSFTRPSIYRIYNRVHGISLDERWLANDDRHLQEEVVDEETGTDPETTSKSDYKTGVPSGEESDDDTQQNSDAEIEEGFVDDGSESEETSDTSGTDLEYLNDGSNTDRTDDDNIYSDVEMDGLDEPKSGYSSDSEHSEYID
ncbi:hypothetical protein P153DRAFT_358433 [Dothidotthia symphoricarpi CBS 119687]|uniref:RING-type domain-containing protein n=1 Tax=Dothidotthia symphoricarpi CBS 119687 TaxID=1392245 RepID=A0A6A6A9N4_9PLEO|nr:uncharacterized protein P153DRAFT_358433 [Dothidotthia symphoricarpi CBS 119687]KAF2127558.1 hypothetical protein P153DRAFT_358433 [Dothidotthia symphoricarpi CBS 119687]